MSFIHKPFRYTCWNATLYIIAINVFIWFMMRLAPGLGTFMALNPYNLVKFHMFWQPFTYMWMHDLSSIQHLLFNMLGLFFFGYVTERALGSKEFLLLYLLSGIFCGLISLAIFVVSGSWGVFLYGASGAVYAVMFAYAVLFPRAKIFVWYVLPVPAPLLVLAYAAIELFDQIFSLKAGISHTAHLAGFAFAWLYFIIRMRIHPLRIWKDAYR